MCSNHTLYKKLGLFLRVQLASIIFFPNTTFFELFPPQNTVKTLIFLFMQCYAYFEKWVDYQRPFIKCHFSDKTTIINNTERRITKRGSHMLRYNQLIVSTIRYIAQT